MVAQSKKPSRRAQKELFRFVLNVSERRIALPDLADLEARLEDEKRATAEAEEGTLKAEEELRKSRQEIEEMLMSQGGMELVESFRHSCAVMKEIYRVEAETKKKELEQLRLEKRLQELTEECARLEAENARAQSILDEME